MSQPETAADKATVAEEPLDLIGCGVCGDIEVFRSAVQEQVADAASDQISDEAFVPEPIERTQNILVYVLPGYPVFLPGKNLWLHGPHHTTLCRKSKTP